MRSKARIVVAAVMVSGIVIGSGPAASAAHCTDRGMPGNSDFAQHVRDTNGPGGHNEGDHRGWSSCEENSPNSGP